MSTIDFEQPLTVSIGNKGSKVENFVAYRDNLLVTLKPGQTYTFDTLSSNEGIYYKGQNSGNIVSGIVNKGGVQLVSGSYNSSTGTFTNTASYSLVRDENTLAIVGTIPYEAADNTLGLQAGNRVAVKVTNPSITAKSDLPSGTICKVTNKLVPSGLNEYTKSAFEDDGSLIAVINIAEGESKEISIKWTNDSDFVTYTLTSDGAKFAANGESVENVSDVVITLPKNITLTNNSTLAINFIPFKQNFEQEIKAGDSLVITADSANQVFYYIEQANANLTVTLA